MSWITVRRALQTLENERLIYRRHSVLSSASLASREGNGRSSGPLRENPASASGAFYADDVGELTLDDPISFSGNLVFVDGATDGPG